MHQNDYFTEKIALLPEDLQEAIYTSEYEKTLGEIQTENKLHIDQGQILETLAMQLMFGDIDAPDFVNGMFNEAHVSSSVAGDILLNIDTRILRRIRTHMEEIAERERKDAELEKLLMTEEEELEDEISNIHAEYYAEVTNALQDAEQELLEEGILPDGSNITDEMLAQALGTTVEELRKREQTGALHEARKEKVSIKDYISELEKNSQNEEKEEILREVESPEKSFIKPLFTPVTRFIQEQEAKTKEEVPQPITPPDHQLQNTHIETPYKEEVTHIPTAAPIATKPVSPTTPVIKKPTQITLTIDPYKEPLE